MTESDHMKEARRLLLAVSNASHACGKYDLENEGDEPYETVLARANASEEALLSHIAKGEGEQAPAAHPSKGGEAALTDDDLNELAYSAHGEAMSFGLDHDVFLRYFKTVRDRAAPPSTPPTAPDDSSTVRQINAPDAGPMPGICGDMDKASLWAYAHLCGYRASTAPDGEARDAARLDWLEQQREAYGFEAMHEGNRWLIEGPFRTLRIAIDAAMAGGSK